MEAVATIEPIILPDVTLYLGSGSGSDDAGLATQKWAIRNIHPWMVVLVESWSENPDENTEDYGSYSSLLLTWSAHARIKRPQKLPWTKRVEVPIFSGRGIEDAWQFGPGLLLPEVRFEADPVTQIFGAAGFAIRARVTLAPAFPMARECWDAIVSRFELAPCSPFTIDDD